jgi:SSS family solute:Na+ symporter
VKGGYFGVLETFRSEMGQTFWTAIFAWTTCFVVTIIISMLTRPRPDQELVGLVYSLTPKPESTARNVWEKPAFLGVVTLLLLLILNLIFR